MIVFFLIISLILNILAITAILLLYLRQNRYVSLENEQKNNITQMEQLLAIYLTEMREENEAFLKELHQSNKESRKKEEEIGEPETYMQELNKPFPVATSKKKAVSVYQANQKKSNPTDHQSDISESQILETIQSLHEQGHSIEEIAKHMNKGKKEIELILKFSK